MRGLLDVALVLVSVLVTLLSAHTLYLTLYTWDRPPEEARVSLAQVATPVAAGELTGLGLARAVAGMHRAGVLHRDITPANIVISRGGAPCLVDFALATSLAEIACLDR